MEQTGYVFVPLQNPSDYPPTMVTAQEQALVTEKFQQKQALFITYTSVDGSLENQTVVAVQPVFLSPLVDQLTGFGQVSALQTLQHLFASYSVIDKIRLEENTVKMMGPYDPAEPLACLIEKLEKGR